MSKIMVTGGAGYKGGILLPKLLAKGYEVVCYDLQLFGTEGIPDDPKLTSIKADIRDIDAYRKAVEGCDIVIHMACISNDPSFELDPNLSKTINFDCFEPLVVASKEAGVKRFLYVSSSSVYGVSDAPEVTEDHPLVPLSEYNKYKGMCEPLLWKHHGDDFVCTTVRPATVCGYSPRLRLDLTVNILTNHAYHNRKITVFGGKQKRPNIHIEDVTDAYVQIIEEPAERVGGKTWNIGYENHTVAQLAEFVKNVVERECPDKAPIEIVTTESNDNRSYHVSSKKIEQDLGFAPKHNIEDAVKSLVDAFNRGEFSDAMSSEGYSNVKTVQKLGLK